LHKTFKQAGTVSEFKIFISMGVAGGPVVYDNASAKANLRTNGFVAIRESQNGPVSIPKVYVDVTTDATQPWFLVFMAYPRVTSPYQSGAVGAAPDPSDSTMSKFSDSTIRTILSKGSKQTRTQWFHTSEADGSVWADGSLNNTSTMYNLFEYPLNWASDGDSNGQRFKRRQGPGSSYGGDGDWITSAGTGCSGPVGGWSNYYQASCVISWFAGCEGAPAYNHCCACPVDRAQKLIIWAN
jgi:hypothetical protein